MKGITRARHALFTSSGDQFQAVVGTLLSGLLDRSTLSKRLGRLDQSGIDAYAYRAEDESLQTVIQCKGFERLEYGVRQQTQCRKEITKYKDKGPFTPEYWLVINRAIRSRDMRDELSRDLDALIQTGKAERAVLLDMENLLAKLEDLASNRLSEWAEARRVELFEFYSTTMQFVDYIRDVPYQGGRHQFDPVGDMFDYVTRYLDNLPQHKTGKYRSAPIFLVTSGFGFGKTSALHAFAREWIKAEGHIIYAPAALLDASAFANSSGLANALLQFVIPEDSELNDIARYIMRDILNYNLATTKKWILLIDGIDESPFALKSNSIAALWGSIKELGAPAIISARDELVDSRPTEFTSRLPQITPAFQRFELLDWSDDLIIKFLEQFSDHQKDKRSQGFAHFFNLVANGQYADIYGDIPKRPLFLGMLAADAWSGREPARQIHRLYGQYFRQKFLLDRHSYSAGGAAKRPSSIVEKFGHDEACERLILIMQDASAQMLEIMTAPDGNSGISTAVQLDTIDEDCLREIASNHQVEFTQLEDLLLHSLLQPGGRDRFTRKRLVRFAHRSYQDWFLARHLTSHGRELMPGLAASVLRFAGQMRADLEEGIGLP